MKTIIALAFFFLTSHFSTKADLFSSGSLEKPIDVDEKSKAKIEIKIKTARQFEKRTRSYIDIINLEIHNESEWNISEVTIELTVGDKKRKYSFTGPLIEEDKNLKQTESTSENKKYIIRKNTTEIWQSNCETFLIKNKDEIEKSNWSYIIESIKGFKK